MRSISLVAQMVSRLFAAIMFVIILGAPQGIMAKSQFEKEWHKPIKDMPLYFKSSVPNKPKDVPAGNTSLTFAGVDRDDVHRANFDIDGVVMSGVKLDGNVYDVLLDSATLTLKDYHNINVNYHGGLRLTYYYDRKDKRPIFRIEMTEGQLKINDVEYLPFNRKTPKDHRSMSIKLTSDLKSKSQPQFDVCIDSIFLVREYHVDRSNKLEPNETELLTAKFNKRAEITPAEIPTHQMLHAVVSDIKEVNKVRDCSKTWLIRENPLNKFEGTSVKSLKSDNINAKSFEPQYIATTELIIPKYLTDKYTVRMSDDKVIVSDEAWEATFVDGTLSEAVCLTAAAQYDSGMMTRSDKSRIMGIKGLPNASTGKRYAVKVLDILPKLAETALYDLTKIKGYDIVADVYINPEELSENIVDGHIIMSVKEKEDQRRYIELALAEEQQFIGPDRLLESVRGHVKDMTTVIDSGISKTSTSVDFDNDGYYTKGSTIITCNGEIPWDKLAHTGQSKAQIKIDKKYNMYVETVRDSLGRLQACTLRPVKSTDSMADFESGAYTIDWGPRVNSIMSGFYEYEDSTSYKYDDVTGNVLKKYNKRYCEEILTQTTMEYSYLDTDDHGNWTKRSVDMLAEVYEYDMNKGDYVMQESTTTKYVETRIISYYDYDLEAAVEAVRIKFPDLEAIFGDD